MAEPVDSGPIDGAEGESVLYDDVLVGYVVTYGDIMSAIEQRFGVVRLASLNGIVADTIAPGDRLLLRRGAMVPDSGGCIERSALGFLSGGGVDGRWVYWIGPELVDRGSSESAEGIVTTDAGGRVIAYTVADGDGEFAIGDRFCLEPYSFLRYRDVEGPLQPGEVLRLAVDPSELYEAAS